MKGFTLIETIIYTAIMAIIVTALTVFVSSAIESSAKSRMLRVSLDNAHRSLGVITKEIKQATAIYTPTSVFDTSPGQLSLKTAKNPPPREENTYVDFYVDQKRLYIKREGASSQLLTSDNVEVANLEFRNFGSNIQINLTLDYKSSSSKPAYQASTTLTTAATLRN